MMPVTGKKLWNRGLRRKSAKILKLRDSYFNKSLEEFVKDKNETTKTIIYKGELVQKLDPVFMDSKYKLIRAHFYAPEKQVFGMKVDTYVVKCYCFMDYDIFALSGSLFQVA